MPFTILFAVFALLLMVVIFALIYKVKGLTAAFITTGIALIIMSILFIVMINTIVNAM